MNVLPLSLLLRMEKGSGPGGVPFAQVYIPGRRCTLLCLRVAARLHFGDSSSS